MYKDPSNTFVTCACLYSGGLPFPIPVFNPSGVYIVHAGYGPIFQTNSTKTGFTCYTYNNVGALPTYAPTKAPVIPSPTKAPVTPSPTKAPTKAPVTPSPTKAPALSYYTKLGTGDCLDGKGDIFSEIGVALYPVDVDQCAVYCNQHKASFSNNDLSRF
jgi:hypothetical protein